MNKTIGKRYRLIEVVGEGGMNTVYKAEDLRTGELVAIKILNGEFNNDEEVVKRFHLESEAIQKLNHDNIVKVFDIGEEDGQNYIVMELLKPHTLKEVITHNERYFNNEDIIDMSLQILYGIKNAHDNKIVHRDIKPQNILLDDQGRLKVSDFGIARVVNSDTMHNMRDAIGSVHYASPEQSRGSFVDERSDIYSFGIVLYELSTGRLPFDGDSAISIAIKHTKNKMVDPSHLNLNLNPSIGNIIKKCIQKEPSQRFQTVEEIIELFEELRMHPEEELGKQFNSVFAVSTETIDMRSIAPYLDLEDEMERKVLSTKEKAKVNMVPMVITISSAIIIGILVLFLIFLKTNRKVESLRPFELDDLTGMSYVEASDLLASKRLFIEQKEAVYDDTVKANHIISQNPSPKSIVQEGKTIKVVVSLGKKESKAPKLVGMSIQEAKVLLNNEEIDFDVDEEFSKEKIGTVVKQWPKAGTKLSSKDKMNLIISMGDEPKMHVMPSLKGMHLNTATATLADLNIIVGTTEYQFDDVIEKDYVIWQSISPNMSVEENTVVNLKISKGKDGAQKPGTEAEADPSKPTNPTAPSKPEDGGGNGANSGTETGNGNGSNPPMENEPAPSIPEELQ